MVGPRGHTVSLKGVEGAAPKRGFSCLGTLLLLQFIPRLLCPDITMPLIVTSFMAREVSFRVTILKLYFKTAFYLLHFGSYYLLSSSLDLLNSISLETKKTVKRGVVTSTDLS